MKLRKIAVLFFLTVLSFSCSSTKITSSWKAGDHETRAYHNVMVWGILTENDSILRNQIESHLVNDLVDKGYHAVSSLNVYESKAYKKLTSKEIVEEFRSTGVDAVITLVLLSKEKEEIYVPPGITNNPVASFDQIDKYYSSIFNKIYTPGYYTSTTDYFWECRLFEVEKDKLVYRVTTKSFNPSNTEILSHENGLRIMKDMLKKKIILDHMPKEY